MPVTICGMLSRRRCLLSSTTIRSQSLFGQVRIQSNATHGVVVALVTLYSAALISYNSNHECLPLFALPITPLPQMASANDKGLLSVIVNKHGPHPVMVVDPSRSEKEACRRRSCCASRRSRIHRTCGYWILGNSILGIHTPFTIT